MKGFVGECEKMYEIKNTIYERREMKKNYS